MASIPIARDEKKTSIQSAHSRKGRNQTLLLHHAFYNSFQACIVSTISTGKIILVNNATCRLLGYGKKELLTKSRSAIFDIKDSRFKKMLKERAALGKSAAVVVAIKKSGKPIVCEITSALFNDEFGIKNSITTITDISKKILEQETIDFQKERAIEANIFLAKKKQKEIDIKNDKQVSDNIALALKRSEERLQENNQWIKYIARASYDVMWDWDLSTDEIYVGDSMEEVFGYKTKNNSATYKDFVACLIPEERNIVEKNISISISSRKKSWNHSFMFTRNDGTIASTSCRAAIIRDEKGKALHLIGALQDISRLQNLEKKLEDQILLHEEDSEKFILATKLCFDVIWDLDLTNNQVYIGEGYEELYGYNMPGSGYSFSRWLKQIHPLDKKEIEKSLYKAISSMATNWERAFRLIRADGTVARVFSRASIRRRADGKAFRMIGALQDLSHQKDLEEKLINQIDIKAKMLDDYKENFNLVFNSSSDVLYDSDLEINEVKVSKSYERQFGYKITETMIPSKDWASHIHPDDREKVFQDYLNVLSSKQIEWNYSYRFLRADGTVASVLSNAVILRNSDGKAYRVIGSMKDVSNQTILEEKLNHEIKLKEKQIEEAAREAKETERSDIGRELHDNINQLLGASKLYLQMAKGGGEFGELYISRSTEYTLMAIEEIRKLSKGLTTDIIKNLGICEAVENMISDVMQVNAVRIFFDCNGFIEKGMKDKFKLNVFRIIQEQINNILKHADASNVKIEMVQNKQFITLSISDDGVGFDTSIPRKGIGLSNIISRAEAHGGQVVITSEVGKGCEVKVKFSKSGAFLD